MKAVFADSLYWIALTSARDQWRARALAVGASLGGTRIITTSDVLVELLNFHAEGGIKTRRTAIVSVRATLLNLQIEVVMQTPEAFHAALTFYESRFDKGYSLTDCISMNVMREHGLTDALTHDGHFKQEGFNILL